MLALGWCFGRRDTSHRAFLRGTILLVACIRRIRRRIRFGGGGQLAVALIQQTYHAVLPLRHCGEPAIQLCQMPF